MFIQGNKKPFTSTEYKFKLDLVPIVNTINSVVKYGKRSKQLFSLKLKNEERSRNNYIKTFKTISSLNLKGEFIKNVKEMDQDFNSNIKKRLYKKELNNVKESCNTFKTRESYMSCSSNHNFPLIHQYNINTDEITHNDQIQNNFIIFRKHMIYTYDLIQRNIVRYQMGRTKNDTKIDNILGSKLNLDNQDLEQFKNKLKYVACSLVETVKKNKHYNKFYLFKEAKINYLYNQIFEKIYRKLLNLNENNYQINSQLTEEYIYKQIIRIGEDEKVRNNSTDFNNNLMKIIEDHEENLESEDEINTNYNTTLDTVHFLEKTKFYTQQDKKIIAKDLIIKNEVIRNQNIERIKEINNQTANSIKFEKTSSSVFNNTYNTNESDRNKDTTYLRDSSSKINEFNSTAKSYLESDKSNFFNNTLTSSIDKSKKDLLNSMSSRSNLGNQTTIAPFDPSVDSNVKKETNNDKTKSSKFFSSKNSNGKNSSYIKTTIHNKKKDENLGHKTNINTSHNVKDKGTNLIKVVGKNQIDEENPLENCLLDNNNHNNSQILSKNETKNNLINNCKNLYNLDGNLLQKIEEEEINHESINVSHMKNENKRQDSLDNSKIKDKKEVKQENYNFSSILNSDITNNPKVSLINNTINSIKSGNIVSNQNKARSSMKMKFKASILIKNEQISKIDKEYSESIVNDNINKIPEIKANNDDITESEIQSIEPLTMICSFSKLLSNYEKEGNVKRRLRYSNSTKEKLLKDLKNIIDDLNCNYIILEDQNILLDGSLPGMENKKFLNKKQHMFFKKTLNNILNQLEITNDEVKNLQEKIKSLPLKDTSLQKKISSINEELKNNYLKIVSEGNPLKSQSSYLQSLPLTFNVDKISKRESFMSIPSFSSKQSKGTLKFKTNNFVIEKNPIETKIQKVNKVDLVDLKTCIEQDESFNNELNRKREKEIEILKQNMEFIKKMTEDDKEYEQLLLQETREKLKSFKEFDVNSLFPDMNYISDNESVLKIEYRMNTCLNILGRNKEKNNSVLKNQNDRIIKVVDKKPINKLNPVIDFD